MPTLGAPELIIILVIIILIFGVGKLPEVGSALGKGIKEFRKSTEELDAKDESAAKTAASAPTAVAEPPRPAGAIEAPRTQADGVRACTDQNGDTIEANAQRHGVSVEALMQANGYSQRDRVLYAGDSVRMPTPTGGPATASGR